MTVRLSKWTDTLDEHAHLRQALSSVREMIMDRASSPAVIRKLLEELTQALLDHFHHEEADGYFAGALAIAPRLTERATLLVRQHPALTAQLEAVQAHIAVAPPSKTWRAQLELEFAEFFEEFRQHEAAENALLQEAFHDDLGEED